jgi:hypothetical protein
MSGGWGGAEQFNDSVSKLLARWVVTVSTPHHCWPVCWDVAHNVPPDTGKNVGFALSETIVSFALLQFVKIMVSTDTCG